MGDEIGDSVGEGVGLIGEEIGPDTAPADFMYEGEKIEAKIPREKITPAAM